MKPTIAVGWRALVGSGEAAVARRWACRPVALVYRPVGPGSGWHSSLCMAPGWAFLSGFIPLLSPGGLTEWPLYCNFKMCRPVGQLSELADWS